MTAPETFPRQHARTRRFTLGLPRNPTITDDGRVRAALPTLQALVEGGEPVEQLEFSVGGEFLIAGHQPVHRGRLGEPALPPLESRMGSQG